jgi:hypothetical protein
MAKLLNIYNFGVIVETHITKTEEEAREIFNAYKETLEGDFAKGCTRYSCTELEEETEAPAPAPAPKKKKSNKK